MSIEAFSNKLSAVTFETYCNGAYSNHSNCSHGPKLQKEVAEILIEWRSLILDSCVRYVEEQAKK